MEDITHRKCVSANADDNEGESEKVSPKFTQDCHLKDVKSSAIVKCTAIEAPSEFQKLSSNTDLKQPPANWLRSNTKWQGRFGQWTFPKKNSTIFSSFNMANTFTDCVGEVDVISDAENIKKLLKIPYCKSHGFSMMVHRVGKTLLLDDFDIHHHLLRAPPNQWKWLRKFFYDHVLESLQDKEKCMLRKNKTREKLQNKNMFSKFLYYSLPDPQVKQEMDSEPLDSKSGSADESQIRENQSGSSTPLQLFSWNAPIIPDPIVEANDQDLNDTHEFLRNVLWTFEDIRMLVGSDMPIFGGGHYPAVSLRLRDMHKPINVLTGLDYWLDNLMCNVPEVMMCYHLDGIVQKYEVIKTEDIPYMKNSQFSPKVVKDIAQNILSFLKSNATKSGHTYWLFKGKDDDVVKLYDLTTLCADMMDEKEQNPFAFPVAMLLYRVARNMKDSSDCHRKQGAIHRLLKNCILLLDPHKHPQIVTSAHYLLADLFVPTDADSSFSSSGTADGTNDDDDDDDFEDKVEDKFDVDNGSVTSPSVEVKALCHTTAYREEGFSDIERMPQAINKNFDEKCHEAIEHVVQGLMCVVSSEKDGSISKSFKKDETDRLASSQFEEVVKMAKPFEAIPLHYSSLQKNSSSGNSEGVVSPSHQPTDKDETTELKYCDDTCFCDSRTHAVTAMTTIVNPSWKECFKIFLLLKATQVYGALCESANNMHKFGQAMKYVKLGIMCYDSAQVVASSHGKKCQTEPLAYLLGLAGDIHLMTVQGDSGVNKEYHKEQYEFLNNLDQAMLHLLNQIGNGRESEDYSWAYEWITNLETNLLSSFRCYQMAHQLWPEGCKNDGWVRLMRRIGNVCNELGVFYMSQATRIWNEDPDHDKAKLDILWKKSHAHLEEGITAFGAVNDVDNIALLHSNIGRLMRICAHSHCAVASNGSAREFTSQERHYYNKAIQSYQKALRVLGQRSCSPDVWDTVTWELSTTFYNMGCLLQDYAPLSTMAQEKIEKEVTEVMFKALKLCESETSSSRQPLYLYRSASIHHRLGSLYHHACRNLLCSGERQKQLRTLAERHYSKACDIFESLENHNDFFRTLLERIGMWEHQLAGLSGFSSKLKTLHALCELSISAEPTIAQILSSKKCAVSTDCAKDVEAIKASPSAEDEDIDELNERKKLVNLFVDRLRHAVDGVVKVYASKSSKFDAVLKTWREMYAKLMQIDEANLEEGLLSIIQELKVLVAKKTSK